MMPRMLQLHSNAWLKLASTVGLEIARVFHYLVQGSRRRNGILVFVGFTKKRAAKPSGPFV